jgi:hypothetical protein
VLWLHDTVYRPILEKVTLKVHFKEDVRLRTTTSRTPDGKGAEMISPGKAQRAYSRAKADNESSRHLGVDSTMNGDTAVMQRRILTAVGRRMEDMRLHSIRGQTLLRYAVNVLLCTLVSYAPLLSGLTLKQMKAIDAAVLAKIRRRCGLTTSDAAEHLVFISRGCNGLGFSTFTGNHITSVARELKVTLNSKQTQAMVARARLHSASHGRHDNAHTPNFIAKKSAKTLSALGIYLRDRQDELANRIMDNLSLTLPSVKPRGDIMSTAQALKRSKTYALEEPNIK